MQAIAPLSQRDCGTPKRWKQQIHLKCMQHNFSPCPEQTPLSQLDRGTSKSCQQPLYPKCMQYNSTVPTLKITTPTYMQKHN